MIETHELTKIFNGRTAVDRLTLEVERGAVFGFLGPNGAGKTTTVRMLCGLIAPTSGSASVAGHIVGKDDEELRSSVGILTESPGLYDKLSARQNLQFYARLYEVPAEKRDEQVKKYLNLLGLWERRDDPVGGFSKGMKQKMAIARALVHEPPVLFLDEPTSALDPESAKTVRDFIAELRSEGRTIFLCTHNLDEADRLCDRIGIIRQHLIRQDTPAGLRRSLFGRVIDIHLRNPDWASGGDSRFAGLLQALPFVKQVDTADHSLRIRVDDPDEQNPVILRSLVDAGAEVQWVGEVQHSLESIYLKLINEAEAKSEAIK